MKVYVYSKKDNSLIDTHENIEYCIEPETEAKIRFGDTDGNEYEYSTNKVKTCIYQN